MTNRLAGPSQGKTARAAGLALLIMFLLSIFAEFVVLSKLVVPGDAATTASNIMANAMPFRIGIVAYLIILALDVVVALALYVLLRGVNRNFALLTAVLRVLYAATMGISLLALALLFVDAYNYGKLVAYAFFIPHLLVVGYLVFRSGYIPRILGILLMIASPSYLVLLYGNLLLPQAWSQAVYPIVLVPATISEISLGLWFLLKAGRIPGMKS